MNSDAAPLMEVVGVTGDGKYRTVNEDAQPFFYIPLAQSFASKRALQIRTLVPPESLAGPVKEQIKRVGPRSFHHGHRDDEPIAQWSVGLSGVSAGGNFRCRHWNDRIDSRELSACTESCRSLQVSGRARSASVLALGANSRDILRLVWKQGVRLVIVGIVVGMIAAWSLTRAMAHMLAGISPSDPVTYITVTILMSAVGLAGVLDSGAAGDAR